MPRAHSGRSHPVDDHPDEHDQDPDLLLQALVEDRQLRAWGDVKLGVPLRRGVRSMRC